MSVTCKYFPLANATCENNFDVALLAPVALLTLN